MKTTITIASATFALSSILVAGCGGSSQDQPPAQQPLYGQQPQYGQPGQPGQPAYGQPAQPGQPAYGQPVQPAYGQPAPAQPVAAAPAPAPAPSPAPAPASNPAADQAIGAGIAALLKPRAATEAKGMKEDGAPIAGMVNEGGTIDRDMNLMPGKCYTVLGQGLPGVTQLDMTVTLKISLPMLPPGVLAQSSTTGANASIGAGAGKCYKTIGPVAVPVVLSIKATKGSGAAGAQVYVK